MASLSATNTARRAAIAGAVALGALIAAPAAPALAQPVLIPGIGTVNVPFDVPPLPGTPAPAVAAAPRSAGERALDAARTKVGAPYVYGATGPNAFDCSGLVVWAYRQAGLSLPRTSQAQLGAGRPVAYADLRPGDLISFNGGSHSALYAGNGQIIHASTAGTPVRFAPISAMAFAGARRF